MDTFGFLGFGFGMIAFTFGITALVKIGKLEKRIEKLEASHS